MDGTSKKLEGWVIVSDGRGQYIGKIVEETNDRLTLSPAFDWFAPTSVDPKQGVVHRGRLALPLETFPGLSRLEIRPASLVRLDDLDDEGARELAGVLERSERQGAGSSRILVPTPVLRQ